MAFVHLDLAHAGMQCLKRSLRVFWPPSCQLDYSSKYNFSRFFRDLKHGWTKHPWLLAGAFLCVLVLVLRSPEKKSSLQGTQTKLFVDVKAFWQQCLWMPTRPFCIESFWWHGAQGLQLTRFSLALGWGEFCALGRWDPCRQPVAGRDARCSRWIASGPPCTVVDILYSLCIFSVLYKFIQL